MNNRTDKNRNHAAFTLIELMVVILIIALLVAMVSGGIMASLRNARNRRDQTMRLTLSSAIQNYRHEYGDWPHDGAPGTTGSRTYAENNYQVVNRLHVNHSDNDKKIRFLEEGRFLTEKGGERMYLGEARTGESPSGAFPVIDPINGRPYEITIDFDNDTVTVKKQ